MIRFGIAGFGRIGQRHAKAIGLSQGAELVAVADPVERDVPDGVSRYETVEQMLREESLDVVCVCTPNGKHSQHAIAALGSGVHVVCEKPLALSGSDARKMLDVANSNKRKLICVLQNRYSSQVQWLKQLVDEGRIGKILQVQVNCFWNRDDRYYLTGDGDSHPWHGDPRLDGGPLFTQFSHFVDLLIWLLGDIHIGGGTFRNFTHQHSIGFEDAGMFDFHFEEGGFGCFHYSTAVWDRNQESSITLVGSQGSIRLGGQYMDRLEYSHFKDEASVPHFPPKESPPPPGNHLKIIENVIDICANDGEPDFDIGDAVRGVELMESVYKYRSE